MENAKHVQPENSVLEIMLKHHVRQIIQILRLGPRKEPIVILTINHVPGQVYKTNQLCHQGAINIQPQHATNLRVTIPCILMLMVLAMVHFAMDVKQMPMLVQKLLHLSRRHQVIMSMV